MKRAHERTIEKAAKLIAYDAEQEYASNSDTEGFVNDRLAWREIKRKRKLAKRLARIIGIGIEVKVTKGG